MISEDSRPALETHSDIYRPAKLLAILFAVALSAGIFVGEIQQNSAQRQITNVENQAALANADAWKDPTYQDFTANPDFQYKIDSASTCSSNSGSAGCGIYDIISKYDCSTVNAEMQGMKADETVVETVKATQIAVTSGSFFSMEFDLSSSSSSKINLISLECIK